ncbi:MAG: hypothetical protein KBA31_19520 [Alphaproteobacteria bacterium]|nr:hypothetical protein [Alphaproteobacteria bacterium]
MRGSEQTDVAVSGDAAAQVRSRAPVLDGAEAARPPLTSALDDEQTVDHADSSPRVYRISREALNVALQTTREHFSRLGDLAAARNAGLNEAVSRLMKAGDRIVVRDRPAVERAVHEALDRADRTAVAPQESLRPGGVAAKAELAPSALNDEVNATGEESAAVEPLSARDGSDGDYIVSERPPVPQRPYRSREQSWREYFWDWLPESLGGPRDDFSSTTRITIGEEGPPFDPSRGYNDRLNERLQRAERGELGGKPRGYDDGVDIDGVAYRAMFVVGTRRGDRTSQGLSPSGVAALTEILFDRIVRYKSAEEAAKALIAAEKARDKTFNPSPEYQAALVAKLNAIGGMAVANDLGTKGDKEQVLVLVDSAFASMTDVARTTGAVPANKAHELGHVVSRLLALDRAFEALPASERAQLSSEMQRLFTESRAGQGARDRDDWARNPEEWIAEVFMVYLRESELAKQVAPLTCSLLRKLCNNHPVLGRILRLS